MRLRLLVSGRVQGINYRYFARSKANELGLTGWIKNLEDGSVEAVVEGNKDKVNEFVAALKKGPFLSKIKDVKITEEAETHEYKEFKVSY